MAASNITYTAAAGATLYAGRFKPSSQALLFDSVGILSDSGSNVPAQVQNQIPVMELHASGGGVPGGTNVTANRQYRAKVSGRMAYEEHIEFAFRISGATSGSLNGNKAITMIRPTSYYGKYPGSGAIRQGWSGFLFRESPLYHMITANRLDGLRNWMEIELAAEANPESVDMKFLCLTGGSMGAWGTMHYGLRRPRKFAALYPDRPRWRWDDVVGGVDYSVYDSGGVNGTVSNSPAIDPLDGGGTVASNHDGIAYVSNPANFVPFIGWSIGSNDGYMPFSDHIDAVAALRANGRPFAMAWNRGNHSGGMILSKILASYPFGTFEIGKGCPLFTEHSLDVDPTLDEAVLEGGVNLGLTFDSVIETPTSWSCRVTSITGPCTVKVKPCNSDVFTADVPAKLVTIPAAKAWVAVSFTV